MQRSIEGQRYSIIYRDAEAKALAKDLGRLKLLPFDTETDMTKDGLDWKRERQVVWQFHNGKEAFLVDARQVDMQIFKPVLESTKTKKLIHNSAFDAAWTMNEHGIAIRNIGDTRLNENLILGMNLPRQPPAGMKKAQFDELKPLYSSSLNFCLQRRHLPAKFEFIPHYWHEPIRNEKGKIIDFDKSKLEEWTPEQIIYDVRDVEHLVQLWEEQTEQLSRMDMSYLQDLENDVAEATYHMMNRGFHIDTKGYLKYAMQNQLAYEDAMDQLKELAPEVNNWAAPGQVSKYFGMQYIAEVRAMTTEQLPKAKQKVFELWSLASLNYKNVTTYGLGYIQRHLEDGSRMRCSLNQIVDTGRYSCDNPNLQQVPVMLKRGKKVYPLHYRDYFIPDKGNVFVVADFKSQELAIIAVGSGEESWIECLRTGGDLHAMVASMVFDDWNSLSDAEKKEKRRLAKDINFGIAYGLGAPGLQEKQEHLTIEECQAILDLYNATFPKIKKWLNQNAQFCVRTGTSYSFPPFNRLRTAPLETERWRFSNIGKNNPVQATGADMQKNAIRRMHSTGVYLIHCVHDELIAECKKSEAPKIKKLMAQAMIDAAIESLDEALTTPDIKIVNTWREAKD
jgi:DNA polymerase-1